MSFLRGHYLHIPRHCDTNTVAEFFGIVPLSIHDGNVSEDEMEDAEEVGRLMNTITSEMSD